MSRDYAGNRLTAARKKLERALKKCGSRCSNEVRAELQRDLGVVLFGLGKKALGRSAFQKALALDPDGRLDPEFGTATTQQAYRRAGGTVGKPEPPKAEESEPDESESDAPTESETEPEGERESSEQATPKESGVSHAWFSLSVQQDWMWHEPSHPACGSAKYACFASGEQYTGPIWRDYGNEVRRGLGFATTRLLVGLDGLLGRNLELGTRLGVAFGGGPTPTGRSKFLPVHAELRAAYFFGADPFARSGVRPYFGVGGGIAEVQSRVTVDFYTDVAAYNQGRQSSADAWRTAGRGFVAPSFGSQFAFSRSTAIALELRVMAMLGTSGVVPAGSIGFVQGL